MCVGVVFVCACVHVCVLISASDHTCMHTQTSELVSLRQKLKESDSVGESGRRQAEELRRELAECERREGELKGRCEALERRVEQLQRESDTRQEHHVNQVSAQCFCAHG